MPNNIIENTFGVLGPDILTQQLVAPILPSMVANRTFAKGDLFIVNSTLYKATTAIAVGDTIAVGTNCSLASTVVEELQGMIEDSINDTSLLLNSSIRQFPTISNGSNYATNSTWYYKIGTRVFVNISVKSLTANSEKVIFTLPVGYRPVASMNYRGKGMSASEPTDVEVASNGNVYVRTGTSSICFMSLTFDAFN